MLYSMTGYGKSTGIFQNKKISVELKSLNSKSLDLYVRLPTEYREKELELRKIVGEKLERGKIEFFIQVEQNGELKNNIINQSIAKGYFKDLTALEKEIGRKTNDALALLLRMPDIYSTEKSVLAEGEWDFTIKLLTEAIGHFEKFRAQEGKSLSADFEKNIQNIVSLLQKVPQYEEERIVTIRERMQKAIEEKMAEYVDSNRLEQELIYYIEKLDVSEEKTRLSNHLSYFLETMNNGGAIGKKLGFIAQEIGREINTLGSKSNHAEMQKLVVLMKDNLEKIKEQVLNTL